MQHHTEIEHVLRQYFDGLYHSDIDALGQVFHPQAHYTCTTNGELVHWNMKQYFDVVRERQSPASLKQTRQDKVLAIDVIGEHTALAKVQCVIFPKYFTDFLSLVRIGERWQIISKVFHFQLQPF